MRASSRGFDSHLLTSNRDSARVSSRGFASRPLTSLQGLCKTLVESESAALLSSKSRRVCPVYFLYVFSVCVVCCCELAGVLSARQQRATSDLRAKR